MTGSRRGWRFGTGPALCLCLAAAAASPAFADAARLVRAYPGQVERIDGNSLVMRDGTRLPLSDGRDGKSATELLMNPDIDDMFAYAYPRAFPTAAPATDPGRIRNHAFFAAMYGDCAKGGLKGQLVGVPWLPLHGGGTVRITTVNGVDRQLRAVSDELDRLPDDLIGYLKPSSGTYNCRVVADTKKPSAHGYGIAIDINAARADYWLWSKGAYRNRVPQQIVDIFERHGFIWGGKWSHFDTMHFEYRPELLD